MPPISTVNFHNQKGQTYVLKYTKTNRVDSCQRSVVMEITSQKWQHNVTKWYMCFYEDQYKISSSPKIQAIPSDQKMPIAPFILVPCKGHILC